MSKYVCELDVVMDYNPDTKTGNIHRFGFEICRDSPGIIYSDDDVEKLMFEKIAELYPGLHYHTARIFTVIAEIEMDAEYINEMLNRRNEQSGAGDSTGHTVQE